MTPVYLNPPPSSPMSFLEFKGDQHFHQVLGQIHDLASSNSSHSTSDESLGLGYSRHPHQDMIKVDKVLSHDKPNDLGQVIQSSPWPQNIGDGSGSCSYGYSSNHGDKVEFVTNTDQKYSRRSWKPSKVRIMQKMMATSNNTKNMREQHKVHHQDSLEPQQSNIYRNNNSDNNNNNNNNGIRVCSDCHTTTTPLWRSGPRGPKSLCNACGIRQRKARRAAMAAAEAAGFAQDGIVPSMSVESPRQQQQQQQQQQQPKVPSQDQEDIVMRERSSGFDNKSHPLPLKKRGKTIDFANRNHNNYDSHNNSNGLMSSSNDYFTANSQRSSFPRDEEEGAILLMALSCGLACSS